MNTNIQLNLHKYSCPLEATIAKIGGKWKCLILWWLRRDARRFSELKLLIPFITQKVLTQQLRELEKEKLIIRQSYAESPPRVEYALTNHGQTLTPLVEMMCEWGKSHLPEYEFGYCHLTGVKILVLALEAISICDILTAKNATAIAITKVQEISSTVDSFQPDVILIDMTIFDQNIQEIESLINSITNSSITLIALTPTNTPSQRRQIWKMGFKLHLSQPIETVELVSTIASIRLNKHSN